MGIYEYTDEEVEYLKKIDVPGKNDPEKDQKWDALRKEFQREFRCRVSSRSFRMKTSSVQGKTWFGRKLKKSEKLRKIHTEKQGKQFPGGIKKIEEPPKVYAVLVNGCVIWEHVCSGRPYVYLVEKLGSL